MVNVLHLLAGADVGGVSEVVVNYYRHIDRSRIHFDAAFTTEPVGKNADALLAMGANVYGLPRKSDGLRAFEEALLALLQQNKYDCIHVHENETSYVAMRIAKKAGVRYRIAHSHTTSPCPTLKSQVRRLSGCVLNNMYGTTLIGCGRMAGERVFGKMAMRLPKAMVLPNAIDLNAFAYDAATREEVRKQEGFDGRFAIGIVARLSEEKNQAFAIRVMKKLIKTMPSALLVLVGNGPDEAMLRDLVSAERMEKHVVMLGRRTDVHRLYQGLDAVIMPSLYEGFPVSAVEALAGGLPLLLSANITDEFSFSNLVRYLPLSSEDAWADALCSLQAANRESGYALMKARNFDLHDTAAILENVYLHQKTEDRA